MVAAAAEALAAESAAAGQGLVRLVTFDPRWSEGFDASAGGFLRSFIAPLIALPLYLPVASVFATRIEGLETNSTILTAAALSHLINAFGFPLAIGLLARPLGFREGFSGFVVVTNWACLALNALLALSALAVFAGPGGVEVFKFAALILFGLSVFITWRAARENLSEELAPIVLVVVLSVAVSAVAEQAAEAFVRLAT